MCSSTRPDVVKQRPTPGNVLAKNPTVGGLLVGVVAKKFHANLLKFTPELVSPQVDLELPKIRARFWRRQPSTARALPKSAPNPPATFRPVLYSTNLELAENPGRNSNTEGSQVSWQIGRAHV